MKNYTITVNGKVYEVTVEEGFSGQAQGGAAPVSAPAAPLNTPKAPAPAAPQAAAAGAVTVSAPMPGKILDIRVGAGQAVKRGDVLMILEAMKMENDILSTLQGTVKRILVKENDVVGTNEPLIEFE